MLDSAIGRLATVAEHVQSGRVAHDPLMKLYEALDRADEIAGWS
jgi:hypothetical protein